MTKRAVFQSEFLLLFFKGLMGADFALDVFWAENGFARGHAGRENRPAFLALLVPCQNWLSAVSRGTALEVILFYYIVLRLLIQKGLDPESLDLPPFLILLGFQ